jgi:hypothetical protein
MGKIGFVEGEQEKYGWKKKFPRIVDDLLTLWDHRNSNWSILQGQWNWRGMS